MTREEKMEAAINKAVERLEQASRETQESYEDFLLKTNKQDNQLMGYPYRFGAMEAIVAIVAKELKQSLS